MPGSSARSNQLDERLAVLLAVCGADGVYAAAELGHCPLENPVLSPQCHQFGTHIFNVHPPDTRAVDAAGVMFTTGHAAIAANRSVGHGNECGCYAPGRDVAGDGGQLEFAAVVAKDGISSLV